jgi:Tfp pilus assembly protein PilN
MRPVNLIPPEDRRGDRAQVRTGVLPYVVVGALVAVLAGVALLVTTSNTISDRKAEVVSLEAQRTEAQARADALAPYADLAALAVERTTTVTSLAQSRFDWDRVLRELALVIPDDVWLTELTGTVAPDVQLSSGAEVQLRQGASGPALSIIGCAAGHESVAAFLQALRDIDGVTRVAIESDARPEQGTSGGDGGGGASGDSDCRTREFISRFQVVAAFDAVAVPPAASTEAAPPAEVSARDSAAEQTGEAGRGAEVITGVAR